MTTYDPALIERLDTEALAAFDELPVPHDGAANRLHLAARGKLCAMADQLEAEKREVETWQQRAGVALRGFAETNNKLDAMRLDRDHWREARRTAMEAGEILKAERDEAQRELGILRRMVARIKPVVEAAVAWRGPNACGYEHDTLVAAIDDYESGISRPTTNEPECPGEDCPMCSGAMCNKCGAGCWNNSAPHCDHASDERHDEPEHRSSNA